MSEEAERKPAGRAVAHCHLPGLFEFYDFYRVFLPLYRKHREYFYDLRYRFALRSTCRMAHRATVFQPPWKKALYASGSVRIRP